jgi:hypothetical protein
VSPNTTEKAKDELLFVMMLISRDGDYGMAFREYGFAKQAEKALKMKRRSGMLYSILGRR